MSASQLIENFWEKYISYTPSANRIHQLFSTNITNDHIAFRTLNISKTSIDVQKQYLSQFGYQERGKYDFNVNKLRSILIN